MPPADSKRNGWNEYQLLVLAELERCDKRLSQIEVRLTSMETSIAVARTKMTIYSGIAAVVLSAIVSTTIAFVGKG